MRTRKSTLFLVVCVLYLSCLVQQCHNVMFGTFAQAMGNSVGSAVQATGSLGVTVMQGLLMSILSSITHGFSTIHTMSISLFSGFMMGNIFFAMFILFLMAVSPAEEDKRSLGTSILFHRPLLTTTHPHNLTDHRGVPLLLTEKSLVRHKRSLLVNNANSTAIVNATTANLNGTVFTVDDNSTYPLPASLAAAFNTTEDRVPRFLTRVIQNDPFNCLPLLLCGLGASRKPSERTEVLNDYAYLLKEFLRPGDDSPEDDEDREEDDLSDEFSSGKKKKNSRLRSSIQMLNKLVQGGYAGKKKDEVDQLIEAMKREEDDKLEEQVLEELVQDPSDMKYALDDLKLRAVKRTMSKLPKESRKKYISKLRGGHEQESEEEMGEVVDDDEDPDIPKALLGRYEKPDNYPDESGSPEEGPYPGLYRHDHHYYHHDDYNPRDLIRGAFPPPPPVPPMPHDHRSQMLSNDELYKRNLAILENSLKQEIPRVYARRPYSRYPPMSSGRGPRELKQKAANRAYLQKKRGEIYEADNVYDRARAGAEVGAASGNNRQCRALFNECPISTIGRPIGNAGKEAVSNAPFLNRAVSNIRRVLLGNGNGESSKSKRLKEIKEVVQQLNPPNNNGGSEVKVVLNIGPSPSPHHIVVPASAEINRGLPAPYAKNPPAPYPPEPIPHDLVHNTPIMQTGMPMPPHMMFPSMPSQSPTGFGSQLKYVITKTPGTTPTPPKKPMVYRNPNSSPASKKPLPTMMSDVNFDDLELLLKTTMPPENSEEATTMYPGEQTTLSVNELSEVEQDYNSVEEDPVLPTKHPMSKEQYAESLRETFKIFNKFKEAHKTPVNIEIYINGACMPLL